MGESSLFVRSALFLLPGPLLMITVVCALAVLTIIGIGTDSCFCLPATLGYVENAAEFHGSEPPLGTPVQDPSFPVLFWGIRAETAPLAFVARNQFSSFSYLNLSWVSSY